MGRSPCCEKAHTNKGAWTKEEDQRLINYIRVHGEGCWHSLPKAAGLLRCGKSCRLRWMNYLRPDLKRGNFTDEEDDIIIKLHSMLGNKWSLIANRLPGRTDNEIKNYWNTHIRRKLINRGIDPQAHVPLNSTTRARPPPPPPRLQTAATSAVSVAAFDAVALPRMPTSDNNDNNNSDKKKLSTSSSKDESTKCNSTTTEESQAAAPTPPHPHPPPLKHENAAGDEIDLELSLGLPSLKYEKSGSFNSSSSAESKPFQFNFQF